MCFYRCVKLVFIIFLTFVFAGCSTGVEGTKKISEKDVSKYVPNKLSLEQIYLDSIRVDDFFKWDIGEKFYITDNQVRFVFTQSSNYDLDTISFKGKILSYVGYNEKNILGTENIVNIIFKDDTGNEFNYSTNKTKSEIIKYKNRITIPFFISLDMVALAHKHLVGKELYIKTPLWYTSDEDLIKGLKFIKVDIKNVYPGNDTFPLKIEFIANGKISYVLLSTPEAPIVNRTFDSIFSFTDIRKQYPTITDDNWKLIIEGKITNYMTKEECRLSLGAPKKIDQRPTYEGLSEVWNYENGVYLIFQDGILKSYRK